MSARAGASYGPFMPRYLVERTFPDGVRLGTGGLPAASVIETNLAEGVTWIHSYVSDDNRTSFSIYDAPEPEAIRRVARANGLPVDRITQVRVLDPYSYAVEPEPIADLDDADVEPVRGGAFATYPCYTLACPS
jgi:hypothetical protein